MRRARVVIKNKEGKYEPFTGPFEAKDVAQAFQKAREHAKRHLLGSCSSGNVYAIQIFDRKLRSWKKKGHIIRERTHH